MIKATMQTFQWSIKTQKCSRKTDRDENTRDVSFLNTQWPSAGFAYQIIITPAYVISNEIPYHVTTHFINNDNQSPLNNMQQKIKYSQQTNEQNTVSSSRQP